VEPSGAKKIETQAKADKPKIRTAS